MTTKWTKGPWKAVIATMGERAPMFGFEITADRKEVPITQLGVYQSERAIIGGSQFEEGWRKAFPAEAARRFSPSEAEANAHLIASAPMLYEALEESLKWLLSSGANEVRKQVVAALRAARGEK